MTTYYLWKENKNYPKEITADPMKCDGLHCKEFKSRKEAGEYRDQIERNDNNGLRWSVEDFLAGKTFAKWFCLPFSMARDFRTFSQWPCNQEGA